MGLAQAGADEQMLIRSFSIWLRCRHWADIILFPACAKPRTVSGWYKKLFN